MQDQYHRVQLTLLHYITITNFPLSSLVDDKTENGVKVVGDPYLKLVKYRQRCDSAQNKVQMSRP